MKRKEREGNRQGSSKQVKFENDNNVDSNKHSMETIREAKSIRKIKTLSGFENTRSILGEVHGNFIEGEVIDGSEKFIDEETNTLRESFNLNQEREEGFIKEEKDEKNKKEEKKKQKEEKVTKILKKMNNKDNQEEEDSEDEEKDAWVDQLEQQQYLLSNNKIKEEKEMKEEKVKSKEELFSIIVNILENKKETVKEGLERLQLNKEQNKAKELIHTSNLLITHYSIYDVYDKPREFFQKEVKWEYQSINKNNSDNTIYGPFDTNQMKLWIDYGMLNVDNVKVRIFNPLKITDDEDFKEITAYDFDRYN
ncbi:hypothetical protein ABK040_002877 [Willaertia magna]